MRLSSLPKILQLPKIPEKSVVGNPTYMPAQDSLWPCPELSDFGLGVFAATKPSTVDYSFERTCAKEPRDMLHMLRSSPIKYIQRAHLFLRCWPKCVLQLRLSYWQGQVPLKGSILPRSITRISSRAIRIYPYIVFNDLPKLRELQKQFPGIYE